MSQHTTETRAKLSASAKRTWNDPQVREARIRGRRNYYNSRWPSEVVIRQDGRDVLLAVTSWEEHVPVVDLAEQPDSPLLPN